MGKHHDKAISAQADTKHSGKGRFSALSKLLRRDDGVSPAGPAKAGPAAGQSKQPSTAKPKVVLVPKRTWKQRLAIFAIKWIVILCTFFIAAVLGAIIGFGFIGGEDWKLVLNWETWKHIYNLVFSN